MGRFWEALSARAEASGGFWEAGLGGPGKPLGVWEAPGLHSLAEGPQGALGGLRSASEKNDFKVSAI